MHPASSRLRAATSARPATTSSRSSGRYSMYPLRRITGATVTPSAPPTAGAAAAVERAQRRRATHRQGHAGQGRGAWRRPGRRQSGGRQRGDRPRHRHRGHQLARRVDQARRRQGPAPGHRRAGAGRQPVRRRARRPRRRLGGGPDGAPAGGTGAERPCPPGGTVRLSDPWRLSTWDPAAWAGPAWTGRLPGPRTVTRGPRLPGKPGHWAGPQGASWDGSSWSGPSWNGSSWSGSSWNGSSWDGSSWN